MAPKAVKITDIKGPDKVAPATTSRPLLVTNRPVITDPMMVKTSEPADVSVSAETVNRTIKVIKPMALQGSEDASSSEPIEALPPSSSDQVADSKPPSLDQEPAGVNEPDQRDTEAEAERTKTALAEAEASRQEELDALIASGKYVVPVGAVQRRRSRVYVTVLCLVGVLLAALLFDVLLDAGIIKLSWSIPHTHFFTTN